MKNLYVIEAVRFEYGATWHGTPAVYVSGKERGTGNHAEAVFTVPQKGPGRHRLHEFIRGMKTPYGLEPLMRNGDYERICRLLTSWSIFTNMVLMFEEETEDGWPRYSLLGVFVNPEDGAVIDYGKMKHIA